MFPTSMHYYYERRALLPEKSSPIITTRIYVKNEQAVNLSFQYHINLFILPDTH